LRYELLVSPESEYQKSLVKLREAKVDLLQQKTYVASLEVNGEEYASATATLQLSEENYDKALAAYEELGRQANAAMEALIAQLRQAEAKLIELEDALFDENIEAKLAEKATEMEANVNAAKDAFFADFEAAHAEDITAIENSLLAKKQELKASVEGNG
jgi:methionine synthase II (cobalamin-independent)